MTRLCVDQTLSHEVRQRVKKDLVFALLEFGLAHDIREFVAVMPPKCWRSVFDAARWAPELVGPATVLGGALAQAAILPVTLPLLRTTRNILGMEGPGWKQPSRVG